MGSDIGKDILDSYKELAKEQKQWQRIPAYQIPERQPEMPRLELPLYEPPMPPPEPKYNPDCNPVVVWESDDMTVISYKGPRYERNNDF